MIHFISEYSLWYLVFCVIIGGLYAFLLYQRQLTWNAQTNKLLSALRFVLVSSLAILLLGFSIRQIKNQFEKPVVVFAIDNSQSMMMADSLQLKKAMSELEDLQKSLQEKDFDIEIRNLKDQNDLKIGNISFDHATTNLNGMLKNIQQSYENRNLSSVILLSDGIYNQDVSPLFVPYNFSVHSVGFGDTIQKKDVNLKAVFHNKIAYLGNKFPLLAEIYQAGFQNQEVVVSLSQNGKTLEQKKIVLGKDNLPSEIQFLISADQKGMQHYVLNIQAVSGEFTLKNNSKHIYVDVLDGKEKILFVASAPHPDIKAIRSAIEKNDNYQIDLYIPNLSPVEAWKKTEKYDLAILHQIPNNNGVGNDVLQTLKAQNTPIFYIIGANSNLSAYNQSNTLSQIQASGQADQVTPSFNSGFNKFTFDNEKRSVLSKFPPIRVPFGNFSMSANTDVVLFQQVGSVLTQKPLLTISEENGKKTATLFGEGVWQWWLQEYAKNENQQTFEELINKTVQYLSTKEDKRKFRVNTTANEYFDAETVVFETECYNNIYEKVFGQNIELTLTNEENKAQKFAYVNAENLKYKINALPQGIYRFRANTVLDGKNEVSSGEFTVKEVQMEALNTQADFNLLRQLSKQSKGEFVNVSQIAVLKEKLLAQEATSLIHSSEQVDSLMNLKWIFFVLMALVSVEWFVRKFKGSY